MEIGGSDIFWLNHGYWRFERLSVKICYMMRRGGVGWGKVAQRLYVGGVRQLGTVGLNKHS